MIYRLVASVARLLISTFYRRVEVVGLERVPARGPLVVVANHNNALIDPALLLSVFPRRLVPVAKAPLFRHPLIAPFLWLAGAIPVHRRQEAGAAADPARNADMFERAITTLGRDRAILIFPEGVSQPEPALMPLRTGAARLVLGAETLAAGGPGVSIVPVGLVYHRPGTFRAGNALVMIGEAMTCADLVATQDGRESPVRTLTERITRALRRLIIEARDRHTLELLRLADAIWRTESGVAPGDGRTRAERLRRILRGYDYLSGTAPGRVEPFRAELQHFARDLAALGVSGPLLTSTYSRWAALRSLLVETVTLAMELPLALWGIVLHAAPYLLTKLAIAIGRPEPDTVATYKVCAGLVLYPLCWGVEAWVGWRLGGDILLVVVLGTLVPAGFFALVWQERLARARRNARALLRFLADRDLHAHLVARRRALLEEMRALAALVPEEILTDEPTS